MLERLVSILIKISKKLQNSCTFLIEKHFRATKTNNYSVEWFFKNIRYLGRLYDLGIEDYDEYVKFQDVLDEIDFNNVTKVYDSQETVIRVRSSRKIGRYANRMILCLSSAFTKMRRLASSMSMGRFGSKLLRNF